VNTVSSPGTNCPGRRFGWIHSYSHRVRASFPYGGPRVVGEGLRRVCSSSDSLTRRVSYSSGRARPFERGPPAEPCLALSTEPEPPYAPRRSAPRTLAASHALSPLAHPTREIKASRAQANPEGQAEVELDFVSSASARVHPRLDRSVLMGYVCIPTMATATSTPGGLTLERGPSPARWLIRPMLPTAAPPFHRPGWVYEEKYDGWRLLAHRQDDAVRLLSRAGLDYTGRFRQLAAAIASLPASTLILDGEVAVFDQQLLSRLDFLRRPDPKALVTPPIYITFDCLYVDGQDLRHCPLGARREVLEDLIEGQHLVLAARRLPAHGLDAWEEVQRRGYEGLVAKHEASAYVGGRTRSWLKVKRRSLDGPG